MWILVLGTILQELEPRVSFMLCINIYVDTINEGKRLFQTNNIIKFTAQRRADEMRMKGHMTAMEAPLYQSYQVCVLHPLRAKTEVHLGILLPSNFKLRFPKKNIKKIF